MSYATPATPRPPYTPAHGREYDVTPPLVPTGLTARELRPITQVGSTLGFPMHNFGRGGAVSSTLNVPLDVEFVIAGFTGYWSNTKPFTAGTMYFTKNGLLTPMNVIAGGDDRTDAMQAAMFHLPLPETGSNKILAYDWNGDPSQIDGYSWVTFWKGIDTASPVRASAGLQGTSLPLATPVLDAQSGDLILAFVGFHSNYVEGSIDIWSNLSTFANFAFNAASDAALAIGSPTGDVAVGALAGTNFVNGALVAAVFRGIN